MISVLSPLEGFLYTLISMEIHLICSEHSLYADIAFGFAEYMHLIRYLSDGLAHSSS